MAATSQDSNTQPFDPLSQPRLGHVLTQALSYPYITLTGRSILANFATDDCSSTVGGRGRTTMAAAAPTSLSTPRGCAAIEVRLFGVCVHMWHACTCICLVADWHILTRS